MERSCLLNLWPYLCFCLFVFQPEKVAFEKASARLGVSSQVCVKPEVLCCLGVINNDFNSIFCGSKEIRLFYKNITMVNVSIFF